VAADGGEVNPLLLLALWSVLSVPVALVVGAVLGHRPEPQAQPAVVPVRK
jgi:hypothetical protein